MSTDLPKKDISELEILVKKQLKLMGEDPERLGLLNTPNRVAESLMFLTSGYRTDVTEVIGDAIFDVEGEEMVILKDIEIYSLCEHHLLPFFGKCHIAYLPRKKLIGLSKLSRIVNIYARRLQMQERLTHQIAQTVQEILNPYGVGVVIQARHLCMMMRGVEKQRPDTLTSCMLGTFKTDPKTRAEFLNLTI